ncbi:MAG: hypothetical protein KTR35_05355, partial [Gammaproteobacteria bacterium]|nr:hypothetical protein [Gammaproteobacteria bacterium]
MYVPIKIKQFGYALGASMLAASTVHAAGEVTSIETSDQLGTPFQYEVGGETYSWGIGVNQLLERVTVDGRSYSYASSADRVELRRDDISDVATGIPCGVFVERLEASHLILQANYPSEANGSGNCDMAEMLASRIVNRGALDVFSNKQPNPKNIERVDYVFDYGVVAPLSADALKLGGHLAAEKRGNNPIQIAAILSLDVLGQPASFGPLVRINPFGCGSDDVCYGVTSEQHNYSFFQSSSVAPQSYPEYLKDTTESVTMAYISAERLGLGVGQRYFGFSYFPEDVDPSVHNLLDPASFPNDTADDNILIGDGADIYGGMSGYFLAEELSVASGKVFNDEDLDATPDEFESGVSGIELKLYIDSDGNGVLDPSIDAQVGSGFESNQEGDFVLPGLSDGSYLLQMNEEDGDIPPGLFLPEGSNPIPFVISSSDQNALYFPLTDGVLPPNDGNTGGNSTSGSSDNGGTDSGNNTSGSTAGTDSGNNTSGTTSGTDSGNNTSGSTAGTDSGNNTSGTTSGTDSGNNTSGSTAGTDSGNNTSGTTS